MKEFIHKNYYLFFLVVITGLVAVYSPLNPFYDKAITTDQAVFFTIAEGLLNGKLAYVDFFDHKGPLLYMILALGLSISEGLIGNFLIELAVIFISVLFLYKIANLFAPKWISVLAVLAIFCSDITLFTTANSEEYIFPLICISVYLFLLQLKNGIKNYQVFIIGFCGMLVFFLKYNYCLIWAAIGILLFVWMLLQREKIIDIIKMCLTFFGGMLASTVPFAGYLLGTGSFDEFMDTYVLYSLHYASYTGVTERVNCIKFLLDTPISIYFYATILLCIVVGIYFFFKKEEMCLGIRKEQLKLGCYFLILSGAILVVASSPGQAWYYYKQGTMVIYVVPIALLMNMLYMLFNKKLHKIICMIVLVLFMILSIQSRLTPKWYQITPDDRFLSAMAICDLIEQHCDENDTMISFSNDCTMYFYSDCEPASRIFFPSATIVEDALIDELMGDLEEKEPKLITYQCDWKNGLTERMKNEAETYTENHYLLLYEDEYRSVYIRNE